MLSGLIGVVVAVTYEMSLEGSLRIQNTEYLLIPPRAIIGTGHCSVVKVGSV